ncbi:DDE superfamily endonuclease [Tepidimonas charontis]|uniref:DDE superfamily endonuclease n=2 Tax=Tepidimonas charontis TaxID=2267262 RepID=A0A554WZ03_9BURK|nr:DDE superfamily endonuclease [Tepidimonas charontis]
MRTLSFEAREERRRQVVSLRRRGWTYEAIAEQTGLSRTGVFNICRRYAQEGVRALKDKRGGRKVGECRVLSPEQEAEIRKLICDKTPDQLKMAFALWSRQAVRELIKERYGVLLTPQGVGKYLARWGFTAQKPIKRANEQRPEAVRTWLDETYPEIARRAKAEGAEIHWGDETGLRSDDVRGRSYAPAGKTPVIRVRQRREGLSVMSTVTNRGKVRWKVFEGAMNAAILIDFMKRLIKDAQGKKVFLILDNLKVHHAKVVKAWLAEHDKLIEVFYLPSYSPELNPDELLNADLKAVVTSNAPARVKGDLKKATVSHLRRLQKSPRRVMRYFQHGPVRYAA